MLQTKNKIDFLQWYEILCPVTIKLSEVTDLGLSSRQNNLNDIYIILLAL